jgi:hypothetical protein
MKTYNSMYVGLCVNNNDPEERGRVQVFVPHIMPGLSENWNGKDIEITCVGDNMLNGLDSETLDKLKKILPWAEAASPILCGSSPGMVVRDENGKAVLNQSPVADGTAYGAVTPNVAEAQQSSINQNRKDLLTNAAKYAGSGALGDKVRNGFTAEAAGERLGSQGACARGTFAVLGALTNNSSFQKGSVGGNASDFTANGSFFRSPNNPITKSGLYNQGQNIGNSTSFTPQIGDVVAKGTHIQVYDGTKWVSDFTQSGIGGVGNDGVLYRMNEAGLQSVKNASPNLYNDALNKGQTPKEIKALTTTDSSGRAAACEAGPQATSNPLENSKLPDSAAAAVPQSTTLSNNINNNGKQVNPLSFRDDIYNYILSTNPSFLRNLPKGASELGMLQQGVNGVTREQSARSVADAIAKMGALESGFSISSSNTKDAGGSYGILQFSAAHANQFYGNQAGIKITPELLNTDPGLGGRAAVGMLQFLSEKGKSAYNGPGQKGMGGIFAARTIDLLAANKNLTLEQSLATGKEIKDYANLTKIGGPNSGYTNTAETINATALRANLVMHPDKGGRTPIINVNNMPKGLFTYPAVGAMLWVFFREGNPLFPVYFAASYSRDEWRGAYGNASPASGNPGEDNPPGVVTQCTILNTGAGGIKTEQVIDQNNVVNNKQTFSIYGPGTNQIHFTEGAAYFYFRDYLRHQVEGPLYESVLGNHESWIQGDSNSVFLGAKKVITGTITKESLEAAQELQTLLNEIQKPLSKPVK